MLISNNFFNNHLINDLNNINVNFSSLSNDDKSLLKNNFNINFKNDLYSGTDEYQSDFLIYGNNLLESKNKIFSNSMLENKNYQNTYSSLVEGDIQKENDIYQIKPLQKEWTQKIRLSCKKNHPRLVPKCNLDHHHNKKCMKTIYVECEQGCNFEYKNLSNTFSFNSFEFNNFFKSHYIDETEFDFSQLLKIDNDNSYKFFNQNVLSFKFNQDYLYAKILNSYNMFLAKTLYDDYQNLYDDEFLWKLISLILENKLTNFNEKIIQKIGIDIEHYNYKHNYLYWINLYEYKDKKELFDEMDKLEYIDFFEYQNDINLKNNSIYLWKQLEKIFFSKENLKNVFFEIHYKTKLNSNHLPKKISLFELWNGLNNNIVYDFSEFSNSGTFEDQSIYLSSINLKSSNNKNISINKNNLGINYFNLTDNTNLFLVPFENDFSTWISFNPEISFSKIFKLSIPDSEISKQYLIKNNLMKLPSNINKVELIKKITMLKHSPFISIFDKELLNQFVDDINLTDNVFSTMIKNIVVTAFDSKGEIVIEILFFNNEKIIIKIDEFMTKRISCFKKSETIMLSDLKMSDFSLIDKNYIIDNLIAYDDQDAINANIFVNTSKDDFLKNVLNNIDINANNKFLNVDLKFKNSFNELATITFNIQNNFVLENSNQKIAKNNNKLLVTSIIMILIFIVLVLIATFILLKRYKWRKKT